MIYYLTITNQTMRPFSKKMTSMDTIYKQEMAKAKKLVAKPGTRREDEKQKAAKDKIIAITYAMKSRADKAKADKNKLQK